MNEPKDTGPAAEDETGAKTESEVPEEAAGAPEEPVVLEAVVEAVAEADAEADEAASEADKLAEAEAEIAELKDRFLRAAAETENVRRRAERDGEDARKYAISGFARDLLAVADNLHRTLAAVPEDARQEDGPLNTLLEGVELTQRELVAAFERHGIRAIEPLGEKFDHNWHQAVVQLDDEEAEPGTVVQVMQIGYAIAERLLRPVMVAVAKRKNDDEAQKVDTTV
jgi:molecular chaperone GrpE